MEMNSKNIALITENCLDYIVGGKLMTLGGGGGAKGTALKLVFPDGLLIDVSSSALKMAEITETEKVTKSVYKDEETIILEF